MEKIVFINTSDYIEHWELLLNDREIYEKLDANPTLISTEEVKQEIDMLKKLRNKTGIQLFNRKFGELTNTFVLRTIKDT